jgi:Ca2+-binding RTX toxin-like protein
MGRAGHPRRNEGGRRRSLSTWVIVAVAAWGAHAPETATAAVVSIDPSNPAGLLVQDTGNETNVLTVRAQPGLPVTLIFQDTGATPTTTAPQCAPTTPQTVQCDGTAVFGLDVALGGGDDTLTLDDSTYALTPIALTLVNGEGGNDTLVTGQGNDIVLGGAGNDRIGAGAGDDSIIGELGDDTELGGPGVDQVLGGPGNDQLFGEDGADQVGGEAGNDTIDGGAGDDDASGGEGADVVSGGDGADRLEAPDGADIAADPAAALGADTVDGGPGDDRIGAGPEADPRSPDVLGGGTGRDTVEYALRSSPVLVSLDGAANDGAAGEGDNVEPDVEDVVGGSGSDEITGSGASNGIDGGAGNDTVSGLGGDDTLQGGVNSSGSDTLLGGDGSDALDGDAGDDFLDGGAGTDRLAGAGGTDTLVGGSGVDNLIGGPGIDRLEGGDGDDTLFGGDPNLVGADGGDHLDGGAGKDALLGGPGDDTLDGGLGPDTIAGEEGRDEVTYENRSGSVTVTFNGKPDDGERGEGDNVASDVEDVVGGTTGDTLAGDERANSLDAGPGDDDVDGGAGQDTLTAGKGADVVRARDLSRDEVLCGPGHDLAIVDRLDTVRDCEYRDNGRRRRPLFRRIAFVRPRRGSFGLRLPESTRFVPLSGTVGVPLGSTINAGRGTVRVVTTTRRNGPVQGAWFSRGAFSVSQARGRRPATVIRLASGDLAECRTAPNRRKHVRNRLVTRTDKKHPGPIRVVGEYSIGAATSTAWVTEDRCDGTVTRVTRGIVRVTDLTRHREVSVHAGDSYLAPAISAASAHGA